LRCCYVRDFFSYKSRVIDSSLDRGFVDGQEEIEMQPERPDFGQPEMDPPDETFREKSTTDRPPEGEDVDNFLGRGRDDAPWRWRSDSMESPF
jgi:hypothetical protein